MRSNIPKVTYWGSRLALTWFFLVGGCDLFDGGEQYIEGEVIPGTARIVEVSAVSDYSLGRAEPSVSPDGQLIAFYQRMDDGLSLRVLDMATGEVHGLTRGFGPDWSPDGAWIAFYDGAAVYKIRVDGSERTALATEGRNFSPDWSPDGTRIAYNRSLADETGPGGTWVMSADGSDKQPVFTGGPPDWHPEGGLLIGLTYVPETQNLYRFVVHDAATGEQEMSLVLPRLNPSHSQPHYSPGGDRLVYAAPDGIWIAVADGSWARRILPNHLYNPDYDGKRPTLAVSSPSWHPDGRRIIYEHFAITSYDSNEDGISFGPEAEGEATLRLLDVDAAIQASNL